MTVKLLCDWDGRASGYPNAKAGNLVTLSAAEESGLVAQHIATTTLTGGTSYAVAALATPFSASELAVQAAAHSALLNQKSTIAIPANSSVLANIVVPVYIHSHDPIEAMPGHISFGGASTDVTSFNFMADGVEVPAILHSYGEWDFNLDSNLPDQVIIDYRGVWWGVRWNAYGFNADIVRSNDEGRTWLTVRAGGTTLGAQDTNCGLRLVCSHPSNRNDTGEPHIYFFSVGASTDRKLYRSVDGGRNWVLVKDLYNQTEDAVSAITSIILKQGMCEDAAGNVYFHAYQDAPNIALVYQVAVGGGSLTKVFDSRAGIGMTADSGQVLQHVHSVSYLASSGAVYIGIDSVSDCRIYKTVDAGANWTSVKSGAGQWDTNRVVDFDGKRIFGTGDGAPDVLGAALFSTTDDSTFLNYLPAGNDVQNPAVCGNFLIAAAVAYGKWQNPIINIRSATRDWQQAVIGNFEGAASPSFNGWTYTSDFNPTAGGQWSGTLGKGIAGETYNYPNARISIGRGRYMALFFVKAPTLPIGGVTITAVRASAPTIYTPTQVFGDVLATAGDGLKSRWLLNENVADGGAVTDVISGYDGIFDPAASNGCVYDMADGHDLAFLRPSRRVLRGCISWPDIATQISGGVRFPEIEYYRTKIQDFAITAWVKRPATHSSPSAWMTIFARGYGGTIYELQLSQNTGAIRMQINGTSYSASTLRTCQDGLWNLVGINVISTGGGSTSFEMFLNGVSEGVKTVAAAISAPAAASGRYIGIGAQWNGTTPQATTMIGKMQDVRFYDRILTSAEWRNLWLNGIPKQVW